MSSRRLEEKKNITEALLYSSDRPLSLETLMKACGVSSEEEIKEIIEQLKERFDGSSHAIQVSELGDGRYIMQLGSAYSRVARRYVKRPLLSKALLRTLAFIAYHQPVYQSKVATARGSGVYKHVRKLVERGFVQGEKIGRTKLLRTTNVFADYFGLEDDSQVVKRHIRRILRKTPSSSGDKT